MTRHCGWCTHAGRDAWERRILAGDSIRVVAAATPFSTAAAQRHLRNHAYSARAIQMRTADAASLHVADFAARLVALGDEASTVGRLATDPRTRLLAIREEREALRLLLANLGIDHGEAVEVISEARVLAVAVSSLVGEWPRIGTELAARLRDAGAHDLAAAFERVGINARHGVQNSPEVAS